MNEKPKDFICIYRPNAGDSLWPAARRGDAEAQAALGRLYLEGRAESAKDTYDGKDVIMSSFTPAFEQDLAEASKWLRKAAAQGHAEARQLLATILAKAKGIH